MDNDIIIEVDIFQKNLLKFFDNFYYKIKDFVKYNFEGNVT